MIPRRSRAGLFALLLAVSCSSGAPPPTPAPATELGAGVVARAGGLPIRSPTVAGIVEAQRVEPDRARDLAIRDALFAAAALEANLQREPEVAFSASTVLARSLLHEIQHESESRGDVTDDELAKATARHWLDLDRPASFRVVHAVVRFDEKADPARKKQAGDLAEALRKAILAARPDPSVPPVMTDAGIADPLVASFRAAVTSFPSEGLDIVIEELPPIAADSRVVTRDGGNMDEAFSRAAGGLGGRGEVSAPVVSPYGSHVIELLERVPAMVVPADERRRIVREEVIIARQRTSEKELLEKLRSSVQLDPAVDSLLATVPVD